MWWSAETIVDDPPPIAQVVRDLEGGGSISTLLNSLPGPNDKKKKRVFWKFYYITANS